MTSPTLLPGTGIPVLRPDWCYLGIDETRFWNIPSELRPHLERILAIYAFNRSVHTHCCEFTPSYWMETVCFEPHVTVDAPDSARESLDELVRSAPCSESSGYMHVRAVETLCQRYPGWFARFTGDLDEDTPTEPVPTDRIREHWLANPKFF